MLWGECVRSFAEVVVSAAMLAVLLPPVASAEEETFQTDVQYVAVDVQVLSGERPVTDLAASDFRVFDEGKPQSIASFGFENTELDLIILLDVSASTSAPREAMLLTGAQALSHLHFRDRVSLVVFNSEPFLVAPLTWDRTEITKRLLELPAPEGGTELNTSIRSAVEYLKRHSRRGARRAIVVLTDNVAVKTASDAQVLNDLWEADVVLNAVLFKTAFAGGTADVRKFAEATGGETVAWHRGKPHIPDLFDRIRKRYLLTYRTPPADHGSRRRIRVDLASQARARFNNLRIRARSGYFSGLSGSEARKVLTPERE